MQDVQSTDTDASQDTVAALTRSVKPKHYDLTLEPDLNLKYPPPAF
jgi:hypothetical protein